MSTPFITEVKIKNDKTLHDDEQFQLVRMEHKKLMEVVAKYGEKVGILQDKQRQEYAVAYEHHMINVQKELHTLREKATAIANDRTRDEKLKKLDSDTQAFRNEALRLDASSNGLRKSLRSMASTLNTVERERDWLIKKLREAKRKYKLLKEEHDTIQDRSVQDDSSQSLYSNDSSYMIDLHRSKTATEKMIYGESNWKERLDSDFIVTRADTMLFSLPKHLKSKVIKELKPKTIEEKKRENKQILGALVMGKARQDAVHDFIVQCRRHAAVGAWSVKPLGKRTLVETLREGIFLLEHPEQSSLSKTETLASELASYPETYDTLLSIFKQHKNNKSHHHSHHNHSSHHNKDFIEEEYTQDDNDVEGIFEVEDEGGFDGPPVPQDVDGTLVVDRDIMNYFNGRYQDDDRSDSESFADEYSV
eukprot:gene3561-7084_t